MNYQINPEESLSSIAKRYFVDINDLCEANKAMVGTLRGDSYNFEQNAGSSELVVRHNFKPGDIIRHFKRDLESFDDPYNTKYLYKVLAIAKHTETEEDMLVYQALYHPFGVFTRPMSMVNEKVPLERYSDDQKAKIKNTYRLELYNGF